MAVLKKTRKGQAEKQSSSLMSKVKSVFSKGKVVTATATTIDEFLGYSPPPMQQERKQGLSSSKKADNVGFCRPSPSPSSLRTYGHHSPLPQRNAQPLQRQFEFEQYGYRSQGPPGRPQNEQAQPASFMYPQSPYNRAGGYASASNISYHPPMLGSTHKPNVLYATNDGQRTSESLNLIPPQRTFQTPIARGTPPAPQSVIPQAPYNSAFEDNEVDNDQLVLLLPTNDGRYLPVISGHGGPNFKAPSPSIHPSKRQEEPRVLYLDSNAISSTSSLYAAPAPARTHLERNERSVQPCPRFITYDDDDEEDESFNPDFSSVSSSPQPGTPNGTQGPNLNRRFDYLPESMVPFWYQKHAVTAPQGSRHYLCATCQRIDLLALFKQEETTVMPKPRDFIVLGSLQNLLGRNDCGLCSLVAGIIAHDAGADFPLKMSDEERKEKLRARLMVLMDEVYYLCPIRFKTTFCTPKLYVCHGKEVAQMCRQSSTVRPRQSMAIRPIHSSVGNLGRLLMKPDQIDFEWIRERMRLCDERDLGKLDYEHTVNLRVIDVDRMCIVDLEHGARYVTLSYTWGNITQLNLLKNNEAFFRAGGLGRRIKEIPKSIRDSIELVRRIGERYIWVDALCIIQDDPVDFREQISEMGNIYKNSILTICVCCGEDANYGLPGMEPGTRKTKQVFKFVGNLILGNAMCDSETMEGAKWDTRGWTLQEKVLSQRKLYISDKHALWWCWHTITAEDENCRHQGWQPGTRHQGMYFYKTEHDLIVSKVPQNSNMDIYAFIMTDYTARELTNPSDAEHAVTGAMNAIVGMFRGSFVQGLPDSELSAALLWSPVGSKASKRRLHLETGKPLFPSWSWLGWEGHVAYPWLIERKMPMSEEGSPLKWKNARLDAGEDEQWFTGEMYRMGGLRPNLMERIRGREDRWTGDAEDGWVWIDQFSGSRRWLHPVEDTFEKRFRFFSSSSPHQLCFRTLSAHFPLDPCVRTRKENHDYLHEVSFVRVLNARGFCAGYIYTPNTRSMSDVQRVQFGGSSSGGTEPTREFIVLSRASTSPDPRIGKELLTTTPIDELPSVYCMPYMSEVSDMPRQSYAQESDARKLNPELDEVAYFDTRLYDASMPWGLFNVMMIERVDGVAYRVAVGRIHVAAFMEAKPVEREIVLE